MWKKSIQSFCPKLQKNDMCVVWWPKLQKDDIHVLQWPNLQKYDIYVVHCAKPQPQQVCSIPESTSPDGGRRTQNESRTEQIDAPFQLLFWMGTRETLCLFRCTKRRRGGRFRQLLRQRQFQPERRRGVTTCLRSRRRRLAVVFTRERRPNNGAARLWSEKQKVVNVLMDGWLATAGLRGGDKHWRRAPVPLRQPPTFPPLPPLRPEVPNVVMGWAASS